MNKAIAGFFFSLLPLSAVANDFPTQARVEYVLLCMKEQGGQTIQNLYACSCALDRLSGKLSYDQYVEVETLRVLIKTPGEKGGAFRDIPDARKYLRSFDVMKRDALNSCTVRVSENK